MKIFDRTMLVIFAFLLIALSLLALSMAFGWTIPLDYLNSAFAALNMRWIIGICSIAVLVGGFSLLLTSLSSRPATRTKVVANDFGEISITLPAVETLVKKAAFQIKGVREVKPLIKITPAGTAVFIRTAMLPGTVIPESAQELQRAVKSFLEDTAGLDVVEVKVLITEVSQETKGRVN
ncbi:MAG: alkaline shock response membrane anchor protein AmaP [Desulfitobacteriaceae bacterium]|nr:alkaline shock response membrane anchor protein AmaP [Desulfitobacteriaceae bacterium]MDD4752341.1 alkaline shock response membrane anchor protein AmaP [Desulfitobacteriaceae bacterium]